MLHPRQPCRGQASTAVVGALAVVAAAGVGAFAWGWIRSPAGAASSSSELVAVREELHALTEKVANLEDELARRPSFPPERSLEAQGREAAAAPAEEARPAEPPTANVSEAPGEPGNPWEDFGDNLRRLRESGNDAERLKLAREMLAEGNPIATMMALEALAELAPEEALAAIRDVVAQAGDDPRSQGFAARAVRLLGELELAVQPDLDRIYQDGSPPLQVAAARAAEERGDSALMYRHVGSLVGGLGSSDMDVRVSTIDSLGESRSPLATPHLLPLLKDSNSEVRLRALQSLGRTADASIIAQIEPLLNDPVAQVRERAERTMERLRDGSDDDGFDGFGRRGWSFR